MNPKWHFNPRRPCDRMRDSANDAFFTAESLDNLSEALVREGIQNSLDAARRGPGNERRVRVRICHVAHAGDEARRFLQQAYEPVAEHFERGLGNGSLYETFQECPGYLTFEDFGTKGLNGDVRQWRAEFADENAFFSFFRAEGRSGKSGENIGRWGIGKQVFPTSSRLHSIFGLSIRDDNPSKVLMGSAVVRNHSVKGEDYQPDAWFGCWDSEDSLVLPVVDPDYIRRFASAFQLERTSQSGLSIVVPWVDERVTIDDLRAGIVRNFFWPILLGELVIELAGPGVSHLIDADSLPGHRSLLSSSEKDLIDLALWAATARPAEIVSLDEAGAARPNWNEARAGLLTQEKLAEIRGHLAGRQRVGVRVPVRVRPKRGATGGGMEAMSCFTVFLATCREGKHRSVFLRDGILIKDVRAPQLQGTLSIVTIDHAPLAGLLGDAEGVNHTQWQKDSPKFHKKYVHGPETIKFVTRSAYEIMKFLHEGESEGDRALLTDLFFVPVDEGEEASGPPPRETEKPGIARPPRATPPTPRPRWYDLRQVDGGFILKPGSIQPEVFPIRLKVQAAHAVRRGDALARWTDDDFVFTRAPLRHEPKAAGVTVLREEGNTIELEISEAHFEFGVRGFDPKRDLVVRVTGGREASGDEENV